MHVISELLSVLKLHELTNRITICVCGCMCVEQKDDDG